MRVPGTAYGMLTRWSDVESDFEILLAQPQPSADDLMPDDPDASADWRMEELLRKRLKTARTLEDCRFELKHRTRYMCST